MTSRHAVFLQIALVIFLSTVELTFRKDVNNGGTSGSLWLLQSLLHRLRDCFLLTVAEEDHQAGGRANIWTFATRDRRAVDLKEILNQPRVRNSCGVERDPAGFQIVNWT